MSASELDQRAAGPSSLINGIFFSFTGKSLLDMHCSSGDTFYITRIHDGVTDQISYSPF